MLLVEKFLSHESQEKKYVPGDIREAYASVLYCCANADGDISDEELASIDLLFMYIPVFDDYEGGEYLVVAEKNAANFTPIEILEGSFSYVKEKLRPQLFCYCCDIFLSDGVITEEEKQILDKIAVISGLDEATTKKIIEVTLIRNVKDD
jgi:uncharacterized tellurite resistance protein B-like protein